MMCYVFKTWSLSNRENSITILPNISIKKLRYLYIIMFGILHTDYIFECTKTISSKKKKCDKFFK